MLKYLVACAASIYCIMILFGDESRRPEVTRQAQDDVTGFTLASFRMPEDDRTSSLLTSRMSEAEAVKIALEAGREYRATRKAAPLRGLVASAEAAPAVAPAQTANLRYVTGSRVNLRAGPGTGNAVVGQLFLGDATEVLGDQDGWYQVRTANGAVSGWIFGKFLAEQQPG